MYIVNSIRNGVAPGGMVTSTTFPPPWALHSKDKTLNRQPISTLNSKSPRPEPELSPKLSPLTPPTPETLNPETLNLNPSTPIPQTPKP